MSSSTSPSSSAGGDIYLLFRPVMEIFNPVTIAPPKPTTDGIQFRSSTHRVFLPSGSQTSQETIDDLRAHLKAATESELLTVPPSSFFAQKCELITKVFNHFDRIHRTTTTVVFVPSVLSEQWDIGSAPPENVSSLGFSVVKESDVVTDPDMTWRFELREKSLLQRVGADRTEELEVLSSAGSASSE